MSRKQPGSIRQTAALLHKAMTPAILIRSMKTYRQAVGGGAIGTATLTGIQRLLDPQASAAQAASTGKTGIVITLIAGVFAWLSSLIGNVITAAEKLVDDAPTEPPEPPELARQALPTPGAPITMAAAVKRPPGSPLDPPG
ncbi:MAG TPA: hypothetical protein VF244_09255 [Acidimicrobiales bacterium]